MLLGLLFLALIAANSSSYRIMGRMESKHKRHKNTLVERQETRKKNLHAVLVLITTKKIKLLNFPALFKRVDS